MKDAAELDNNSQLEQDKQSELTNQSNYKYFNYNQTNYKQTNYKQTNYNQWVMVIVICIIGIICLIIWGLISIFNPAACNQLSDSSMITIDGNGIFLIICIIAIVAGAILLLKGTNKK